MRRNILMVLMVLMVLIVFSFAAFVLGQILPVRAEDEQEDEIGSETEDEAYLRPLSEAVDQDQDGVADREEIRLGLDPGETNTIREVRIARRAFATAKRKPICRRAGQRNCRKPICRRPGQKNCRRVKPTPTPRPTPRATPRPTATPSGSFDGSGNTTRFGIPSGLTGNIGRGSPVWAASCAGCHRNETLNRTYGQLSAALNLSAMQGISLSNQKLADLTAYLNRGQP